MTRRPSILCVDGDEESLERTAEVLRGEFEVTTAATPDLAKLLLEDSAGFDVVCADGRLPGGMSGDEFLRSIAQSGARSELVLFTSTRSLFLGREAAATDVICYVFKPWTPDRLLEVVRSLAATAASKAKAQG